MTLLKPVFKAILAAEFAAITLLLALCVPTHIVFQERCQLFLWTGAYFREVVSVPGGLADWIGRLFTQFFISPWAGAAMIAALLVAFQRILLGYREDISVWFFSLTVLPVATLGAYYANENAMLSAAVALILSLLSARGVMSIRHSAARMAVALLAVPVLYMALGPLCLLFLVAISVRDRKAALAGIPVLALTVFVSSLIFQYPLKSLAGGVHYYRFLQTVRPEPWYALAASALPLVLTRLFSVKGRLAVNLTVSAAVVCAAFFLLRPALDNGRSPQKEETLRYALMAEDEDWEGIIKAAGRRRPSLSPVSVACLNLALAQTGRLPDGLFKGFQNGPQGLISDRKVDFISPLAMAQVYWALGLVDSAQRLVYEAQESIPDFQKSAFCYKWLARTNLANGDVAVADKYLEALGHTLFYRNWHPSDDLGLIARRRLTDKDLVSSDENMHQVLSLLVGRDSSNTLARDYLLAYDLLVLELDSFVADYQAIHKDPQVESTTYAEALALAWARGHRDFEDIPWMLPDGIADRCVAFFGDRSANRSQSAMKGKYGTTYWYYYFFHGK